jgi:hypothetical protein
LLGLQPGGWLSGTTNDSVAHFVCQLVGLINVLTKGVIGVCVMMWIRWTLPRLRIDQVMTTCLKYCTPISAVMFLGAALWHFWLPDRNFFGITAAPAATYALSEGWAEPATEVAEAQPSDTAPDEGGADSNADGEADSDAPPEDASARENPASAGQLSLVRRAN